MRLSSGRCPFETGREPQRQQRPAIQRSHRELCAATLSVIAVLLGACSQGASFDPELGVTASPRVAGGRSVPKGGGVYKVGSPYKVAGRWYVPSEDRAYDRTGVASWYGSAFHGRRTSNGEIYDMYALTAGHPTMALPSYAYVTNLQNGRTILVRVNDRGPYVNDRLIDLSWQSAKTLGFDGHGLARVRVRYAGRAPLDGNDRAERQHLAAQDWNGRYASVASAPAGHGRGAAISTGSINRPDAAAPWSVVGYRQALESSRREAPGGPPSGLGGPPDTYVNVGPFASRAEAERMRYALNEFGTAEVGTDPAAAEASFGVRVGPFSRRAADAAAARISAAGIISDASARIPPGGANGPSLTRTAW